MRRMITETDVEKLDSIKPSEIQKLGKITDADIESVKAMQSPKDANANQVLTADGNGKAVYKAMASSVKVESRSFSKVAITTNENGTYGIIPLIGKRVISVYMTSTPTVDSQQVDLSLITTVPFPGSAGDTFIRVYFSPEAITKYSITATSKCSGDIKFYYL